MTKKITHYVIKHTDDGSRYYIEHTVTYKQLLRWYSQIYKWHEIHSSTIHYYRNIYGI